MIPNAVELIEPLVGTTILTLDQRVPNDVLGISGSSVVVGTKRTEGGANVPLRLVQRGLDILFSEGEVRIEPATFGGRRRSSFVGAALGTLSGVEWTEKPVWVRLTGEPGSAAALPRGEPGGGAYPAPEVAAAIDMAGIAVALDAIRERFPDHEVEEMPHSNPGFDVTVRHRGATVAYIEVKSTASLVPGFFMSENECDPPRRAKARRQRVVAKSRRWPIVASMLRSVHSTGRYP